MPTATRFRSTSSHGPRPPGTATTAGRPAAPTGVRRNPDLVSAIEERQAAIAELEDVDPSEIPADAVTASASGLDPHISPAYALLQVPRVAAARGLSESDVRGVVEAHIQQRDLGYLGQPRVNVVELNLALDALGS
jgi:K+-transporting ATPase ATPase C chain